MFLVSCLKVLSCTLLVPLLFSPVAIAHQPKFVPEGEGVFWIADYAVSSVYYGRIGEENREDVFRFAGQGGDDLFIQMLVPFASSEKDFEPEFSFEIVDGKRAEEDGGTPNLKGGRQVEGLSDGEVYFEPFTQTRYWKKQVLRLNLPAAGMYQVQVFDREGAVGRYALVVGEKEKFAVTDLFTLPYIWLRVRLWYNPLTTALILLAILLFFSFVVYLIRRKKNKEG